MLDCGRFSYKGSVRPTFRPFEESDRSNIVRLYIDAFADPPWNETWTEDRANETVSNALSQKDTVFVVSLTPQLAGFAWSYGFKTTPERLASVFGDMSDLMYGGDIVVDRAYRGNGVSSRMFDIIIYEARRLAYKRFGFRTRTDTAYYPMFSRAGIKPIKTNDDNSVYMETRL